MKTPEDSRPGSEGLSDDALLSAHEKQLGHQPDDKAHYRLLPLGMLFVLSGLVLFAATYLNRYSGHFDARIYNENELPTTGATAPVKVDPVVLGDRLYHSGGACYTCHQPTGQGLPGVYPPLAGSEWAQGPEARVIRIVLYGLQGPVHVEGKTFGAAAMPTFGEVPGSGFNWSDEKIAAVLTYVRQEWGNHAGPITADQVAAVRNSVGAHPAWSESDLLQVKAK